MAKLLNTNAQIRSFLGAAYSASDDINRIGPYLDLAESQFIGKAISPELLSELKTAADNESNASANVKVLLGLTRRALAFYGYLLYLPYSTGNDGDNGLQETKTERTQPIRQAMLNQRIMATADNASQALEAVLSYLFDAPNNFSTWKESATYKQACELFIRNGHELKLACSYTRGHHRLYVSMREHIAERQRKSIVPVLGEDLADGLLERMENKALTDADKLLLPYIQRALGYSAYVDSLMLMTVVQLPNGGLRILSEFDGINNQRALSDQDVTFCKYQEKLSLDAESYMRELKKYLEANADSYPDYVPTPEENKPKRWPINNKNYKTIIRLR